MDVRLGLLVAITWFVLLYPAGVTHRAHAEEKLVESPASDTQSNKASDRKQPSITVQDQSRRLLSPGFRITPVPASATGKQLPELHLENSRVFKDRKLFRSNEPPLLLQTAAYGLSQAVKLANHKIGGQRHPLLIDAATSRDVSHQASMASAAACKHCGHGHAIHASRKATPCSSDQPCDDSAGTNETPVETGAKAKTVQELVNLMEELGPGVLDGSIFNPSRFVDTDEQSTMRQTLVQNLQLLEAQNSSAGESYARHARSNAVSTESNSLNPWYDIESDGLPPVDAYTVAREVKSAEARIDALRSSAEQLDDVANQLERRDLYYHSDQLRELASQLRVDARNARIALLDQSGVEVQLPEIESADDPLDLGPITRNKIDRLEAQLEQLLQAARLDRSELRR